MTEKRFFILKDEEYDDVLPCIRDGKGELDDIYGHYKYDDINQICDKLNALHEENEYYKSIFFELVETALTDKSCRELYCKGILGIFDKANSLNQARDMIKEHMN